MSTIPPTVDSDEPEPQHTAIYYADAIDIINRIRAVLWQEDDGTWNDGKECDADTIMEIIELLVERDIDHENEASVHF